MPQISKTLCVAVFGVQGSLIEVAAELDSGPAAIILAGMPDASRGEAQDRVRAAITNSGHDLPPHRVTIHLTPSDQPKRGTGTDLAITVAVLGATGVIPAGGLERFVHIGKLALGGQIRPVRGVVPAALAAVQAGRPDLVVAAENLREAQLVPGARPHGVRRLSDVIRLHSGPPPAPTTRPGIYGQDPESQHTPSSGPFISTAGRPPDLATVVGRSEGRRAVEVAAAGGHHLLLIGPSGAGTSTLAVRLPALLPDLSDEEALEVTAIHSVAGTLDRAGGLIRRPPFEHPHYSSSLPTIVGGGPGLPRPGAMSRAHRGVLLLDEAGEFDSRTITALRQPLDQGDLLIHQWHGVSCFPARFQLVMATSACPCGQPIGADPGCVCTPLARRGYQSRLPEWLLNRVDLHVDLSSAIWDDLESTRREEDTATVAARVGQARAAQRERLRRTPWSCNRDVSGHWLQKELQLPTSVTQPIDRAREQAGLSLRGYVQCLRVAWTLADLAGHDWPVRDDLEQAFLLHERRPQ